MARLKVNQNFSRRNIILVRMKERKITLLTYTFIILILGILAYFNLPKTYLIIVLVIVLFIGATIRYFFSCFRARFKEVKIFCRRHNWKNLILESGQYLAFPFGGVMPVPVPVATNEALDYLDTKSDLADIVLMPIGCVLGAIIGYREEINWWQTLIATTLFLYMAINFRQLEELVFKIFIKLNRV